MASDTNLKLPEDILELIWKTYNKEYILPLINNRKESKYIKYIDKWLNDILPDIDVRNYILSIFANNLVSN